MILLETVNRQSIVKNLLDAMVATKSVDSTELSDFVDAFYVLPYDRWSLCEIDSRKLFDICRKGHVFDKWSECDNSKSGRFAGLTSSDPPPIVLYLNRDLLVLLDGRHRLVTAREKSKSIRVALPSTQFSRFKVELDRF